MSPFEQRLREAAGPAETEAGLLLAADCISHLGANKPRGQEPRPIA